MFSGFAPLEDYFEGEEKGKNRVSILFNCASFQGQSFYFLQIYTRKRKNRGFIFFNSLQSCVFLRGLSIICHRKQRRGTVTLRNSRGRQGVVRCKFTMWKRDATKWIFLRVV